MRLLRDYELNSDIGRLQPILIPEAFGKIGGTVITYLQGNLGKVKFVFFNK